MKIPGIVVEHNIKKEVFVKLNPEYKEAVNVTCIVNCEIKRIDETKDYEYKVNEIKVPTFINNKFNINILYKLFCCYFLKQKIFINKLFVGYFV